MKKSKVSRKVLMNYDIVNYEDASIHINSSVVKYGASVFEGIRGYYNKSKINIIFLEKHINRLLDSAKLMKMNLTDYNQEKIIFYIKKLIKINKIQCDCYIRCALSVINEGGIAETEPVLLSADVFPKTRKPEYYDGIKVCISSWQRINDNSISPRIKCISNYQNARIALIEAKKIGFDDIIFLNKNGYIAEASTSNIFFIKGNQLITTRIEDDILQGITRSFIKNIAKDVKMQFIEKEVTRTEAYLSEEAFLCGTGAEILPISQIDGYQMNSCSQQSSTRLIQKKYEEFVKGDIIELNKFITKL